MPWNLRSLGNDAREMREKRAHVTAVRRDAAWRQRALRPSVTAVRRDAAWRERALRPSVLKLTVSYALLVVFLALCPAPPHANAAAADSAPARPRDPRGSEAPPGLGPDSRQPDSRQPDRNRRTPGVEATSGRNTASGNDLPRDSGQSNGTDQSNGKGHAGGNGLGQGLGCGQGRGEGNGKGQGAVNGQGGQSADCSPSTGSDSGPAVNGSVTNDRKPSAVTPTLSTSAITRTQGSKQTTSGLPRDSDQTTTSTLSPTRGTDQASATKPPGHRTSDRPDVQQSAGNATGARSTTDSSSGNGTDDDVSDLDGADRDTTRVTTTLPANGRVSLIGVCKATEFSHPQRNLAVPELRPGQLFASLQLCVCDGLPLITAACETANTFLNVTPNVTLNVTPNVTLKVTPNPNCNPATNRTDAIFPFTRILRSIVLAAYGSKMSVDAAAASLAALLNSSGQSLTAPDAIYLASFLQDVVNGAVGKDGQQTIGPETAGQLLQIGSSIMTFSASMNTCEQLGNRVLQLTEHIALRLTLGQQASTRVVTDSIVMEVWNLTSYVHSENHSDDVILGLDFRHAGDGTAKGQLVSLRRKKVVPLFDPAHLTFTDTLTANFLPARLLRRAVSGARGQDVTYVVTVYANNSVFEAGGWEDAGGAGNGSARVLTLNSLVISATLLVNGRPQSDLATDHVTNVFQPFTSVPESVKPNSTVCVFWNVSGSGGKGAWSTQGCVYIATRGGRDVCLCNHLTNFAILMDLDRLTPVPDADRVVLSYITIVGLSLSIAGLFLTVLSFLLIGKLRQGRAQKLLFNMALSMLLAWAVFVAGFERTDNDAACLTVAVLLHYLILTSFCWMLVQGLLQFLLFVRVMATHVRGFVLKAAVFAWGAPLIPVVTVLIVNRQLYRGSQNYCWLAAEPFYFAFLAPVGVVIVLNLVIYVLVVISLCCRGRHLTTHGGQDYRTVGLRASLACFVILGLSWILAFLAVEDARLVFQYLFTITASTQGVIIFLIFTARDPLVRQFCKDRLARLFRHGLSGCTSGGQSKPGGSVSLWVSGQERKPSRPPPPLPPKGTRARTTTFTSSVSVSGSSAPSDVMDTEEEAGRDLYQND